MKKVVVAAALAALATVAVDAYAAKSKKQTLTCKPSKGGAMVDKVHKSAAAVLCPFTPFVNTIQLSLVGTSPGRTTKSLLLIPIGWDDPRTATLPQTIDNQGNGVLTGTYSITKLQGFTPVITSWAVDQNGGQRFSVTLTKYDAATSRVSGTFEGTMLPGDNSPNAGNLSIKNGKFSGIATFTGL